MRDGTETRLRLEREAMRLFVERGIAETSVRDVAKAAGVAEGAMYRHFAGKEALVAALFLGHYLEFAQTLDQLAAGAQGTRAKLDAMIGGFCRFFDRDPVLFRFLLFVQHRPLEKVPAGARSPVDVFRDTIAAGMRAGEIPKGDAEFATAMVIGLLLQTATALVYHRLEGRLAPRARRLADAALAVLRAPPAH